MENMDKYSWNRGRKVFDILYGVKVGMRNSSAVELAKWFYETHTLATTEDCFIFLNEWNGRNEDPLPLDELMEVVETLGSPFLMEARK